MREFELNTLIGMVSDPIHNVYPLDTRKNREEIQRIVRIFNMAKAQKIKHKILTLKQLKIFKLVMSNN